MKKIFIIICLGLLGASLYAQAPQVMNYQAIARAANGEPLGNESLIVKFEIFTNSLGVGQPEFTEEQSATSDPITGLFNLKIGSQNQAGFDNINWVDGPKYLRTTINGEVGPLTQLLSVPYALYAETSGNGGSQTYTAGQGIAISGNVISNTGDNDNSTTNELQSLQLTGNQLSILPSGNSVMLPLGTDAQQLSISGNQITISNGNTITLPPNNDNSATNEIQTLTLNGNTLTLQPGGGSVTLPTAPPGTDDQLLTLNGNVLGIENGNAVTIDANPTNELQTLVLTGGNQLSLNPNGGTITLPSGGSDDQNLTVIGNQLTIENGNTVTLPTGVTYIAGTGIAINGTTIANTGDLSSTNEIQSLSLSGNTLTLNPSGGSVTLDDNQALTLNGNQLSIENGNTVTLPTGTTYTAGTGIGINGNIISNTGDGDNSTSNELQMLSVSGNQLTLSNGNTVTLPTTGGSNYQAGNGITINGTTISANDPSPSNEIQQLQLNNSILSLTPNGGSVVLPGSYIVQNNNNNPGTTCGTGFLPFDCTQCSPGFPSFRVQNNCDGTAIEGVSGSSAGPGAAVKGIAGGFDGNGAWGECNSGSEAWGVFGTSNTGWGVVGFSGNPTVEGAGLYNGRIIVTNTLNSTQMANWASQSHTRYNWNGVQTVSDVRLKKDIRTLQYGLKDVLKMRPVSYLWKTDEEGTKKTLGFIAQEMEVVVPDLVDVPKEENESTAKQEGASNPQKLVDPNAEKVRTMNYAEITPILVKAIQEQQAQIEELKGQLQNRDAQIGALSAKMDAIENLLKDIQASAGK